MKIIILFLSLISSICFAESKLTENELINQITVKSETNNWKNIDPIKTKKNSDLINYWASSLNKEVLNDNLFMFVNYELLNRKELSVKGLNDNFAILYKDDILLTIEKKEYSEINVDLRKMLTKFHEYYKDVLFKNTKNGQIINLTRNIDKELPYNQVIFIVNENIHKLIISKKYLLKEEEKYIYEYNYNNSEFNTIREYINIGSYYNIYPYQTPDVNWEFYDKNIYYDNKDKEIFYKNRTYNLLNASYNTGLEKFDICARNKNDIDFLVNEFYELKNESSFIESYEKKDYFSVANMGMPEIKLFPNNIFCVNIKVN